MTSNKIKKILSLLGIIMSVINMEDVTTAILKQIMGRNR